jgi:hypothetical protein
MRLGLGWSCRVLGNERGGKTIGRARRGRAPSDGPMRRAEFLRIPILRNLTCTAATFTSSSLLPHITDGGSELPLSIRPTTRS